jgi:hypothetical protein
MKRVHGWELALLVLTPLGQALGCSCAPAASAPACEKISTAEVVFVGTVRAIERDAQFPTVSKFRVYRFQVETPHKGLPPNVAEVVVNPDDFTSCQTEYKRGMRYLIFASRLAGTNEVLSGGCHGSRLRTE